MKFAKHTQKLFAVFLTASMLVGLIPTAFAALGDAKLGFNEGGLRPHIAKISSSGVFDDAYPTGTGFNGDITAMARQADGKMVVGGNFTSFNGVPRNFIARLKTDGSLDPSFDPGTGFNGWVTALVLDGNDIIVSGYFETYNGIVRHGIARLKADGALDLSFDPGTGFDSFIYALVMDGNDVVVGGQFTAFNGVSRNRIARLNSDGSLDQAFDPRIGFEGMGFSTAVFSLVMDGTDVVAGGQFASFDSTPRSSIARINTDGSLDTNFDPGTGFNGGVFSVALDGNMVVAGGDFNSFNGFARNNLARIKPDGSLDNAFTPSVIGGSVFAVAVDGSDILIGGVFTKVGGLDRQGIARLNSDGSLDTAFNVGGGVDSFVFSIVMNGTDAIIGGRFVTDLNTGFNDTVLTIAVQPDGKIVVGGEFTAFDGTPRNHIARLNADGTLDASFNPGASFNGPVYTVALDGNRILVGGLFTTFNGTTRNFIARLKADGSLDMGFDPQGGFNSTVTSLALDGGRVYAGGFFTAFNGNVLRHIARLNSDGTLDASFNAGTGFDSSVNALIADATGVYAGGFFTSLNGVPRNRIARLNTNGSIDASFNPGAGFDGTVLALTLDGTDVVTGGRFTSFNGVSREKIARLNRDGSLDTEFNPGLGFNSGDGVYALAMDGTSVLAGGTFVDYQGIQMLRLARLTSKGALDSAIDTGNGFDNNVLALAMTGSDVLVGGEFLSYRNQGFMRLAKIDTTDPAGFSIAELDGSTHVSEDGTTDTVTIALRERPTANVSIGVKSSDASEMTAAPQILVFTPTNWSIPQTVTVQGVDDAEVDGTQHAALTFSIQPSTLAVEYQALAAQSVSVTIDDNDSLVIPPTITLLAPNGGESLIVGGQKTIRWQQTGNAQHAIALSLSTNGGVTYAPIAVLPAPAGDFYQWTVPNTLTSSAKIRVEFVQNGVVLVSDVSDAVFSIVTGGNTPPSPPILVLPPPRAPITPPINSVK